jgi:hypothetical protein
MIDSFCYWFKEKLLRVFLNKLMFTYKNHFKNHSMVSYEILFWSFLGRFFRTQKQIRNVPTNFHPSPECRKCHKCRECSFTLTSACAPASSGTRLRYFSFYQFSPKDFVGFRYGKENPKEGLWLPHHSICFNFPYQDITFRRKGSQRPLKRFLGIQ